MEKRKFLKSALLSLGFALGKGVKANTLAQSDVMAPNATPSPTPSNSATTTPSVSNSASTTPSYSGKPSSTPTTTYKWDGSASPTPSTTPSYSGKPSSTPTATYKWDGSASPTTSPTNRESATPSITPSNTPLPSLVLSASPSRNNVSNSATPTSTLSSTPFVNVSATSTPLIMPSSSQTPSKSKIVNASRSRTPSKNNTSINEFDSNIKISEAYPNPVSNDTLLDIDLNQNVYLLIEVINYEGKLMNKSTVYVTSGKQTISVASNDLSTGIYFCKISFNGYSTVKKFIKI